jgi:Domain of unknown function (DUF4185)
MITRRAVMRALGFSTANGLLSHVLAAADKPAMPSPRILRYPRSGIFPALEWLDEAHKYPGSGTDMHWWTWGADGALFLVDDDGSNFGLPPGWKHLLRVTGTPPNHHVEEISSFPELHITGPEKTPEGKRRTYNDEYNLARTRYVCGALAVGNRLYVSVYDYNDLAPGKPRQLMDGISPHAGIVGIMYSDDHGKTWRNVPSKDDPSEEHPYFLGPRFAGLQFVGFGPGYADVPADLDGYVYAISNDSNWASGDHIFLARAPRDKVLERNTWEFYAGAGEGLSRANPAWVREEENARPILTDPGHVGHPDMSYNRPLRRFFLSVFSDAVPHSVNADLDTALRTWDKRAELQIYEGPTPWGPWAVVHNDPWWEGPRHVPYLPHLPTNWWSADGRSGVLMFSGDYTANGPTPHESPSSYYGVVTRRFRLVSGGKGG